MLTLKKYIKRIDDATSRAFIGNDENDEFWVIRPKLRKYSSKRLFNEYFSEKLGKEFIISRPPVELIKLDINISSHFDEVIDYDSPAVATKYYDFISSVDLPPNSDCSSDEFPKVNVIYLKQLFGKDNDFEEFYAYRIFSAWICLEDYWKYNNLHLNKISAKPVFIDFDFSFKGAGWFELPTEYIYYQMESCAPFLDGIITDIKRFEKYYEILRTIKKDKYQKIINSLPENWEVPKEFNYNLIHLLFEQRNIFINEFAYIYDEII